LEEFIGMNEIDIDHQQLHDNNSEEQASPAYTVAIAHVTMRASNGYPGLMSHP
jgi:hypothetical protein